MITKAYLRRRRNGSFYTSRNSPGCLVWAKWKNVTSGIWEEINERHHDLNVVEPAVIEKRVWRFLLEDSSLFKNFDGKFKHLNGVLTDEAELFIMNQFPYSLMSFLVSEFYKTIFLSKEETERIKMECRMLWSGNASSLKSPHPLLEEALECMNMYERYGIPSYQSMKEIPQKTLSAMRLVSSTYHELTEMNQQTQNLRESAMQQAGLRPY